MLGLTNAGGPTCSHPRAEIVCGCERFSRAKRVRWLSPSARKKSWITQEGSCQCIPRKSGQDFLSKSAFQLSGQALFFCWSGSLSSCQGPATLSFFSRQSTQQVEVANRVPHSPATWNPNLGPLYKFEAVLGGFRVNPWGSGRHFVLVIKNVLGA